MSVLWCLASRSVAQDVPVVDPDDPIIEVEADWRIMITAPDEANSRPQLSLILSPFPHLDSWFVEMSINTWRFAPNQGGDGGLMVRIFNGETLIAANATKQGEKLRYNGEYLYLTQAIQLDCDDLKSRHVSCNSPGSWGSLGAFEATYTGASVNSLDQFSVLTTVRESGVTAGKNRVATVDLLQVRCIHESGAVQTLTPTNGNVHRALVGDAEANTTIEPNGAIIQTDVIPPSVQLDVVDQ